MTDTLLPTGVTKQIPRSEWKAYLDRFTRQHLTEDPPEAVTVEVFSPTVGDQFEARTERLLGLTYDPKSSAVEVLLEDVDHLVFQPVEIWVIETGDGFISTMELVRADGTRELLYIHRSGPPAPIYEGTTPPFA
jgi:hypothetical protein